jgi:hypothetical protein
VSNTRTPRPRRRPQDHQPPAGQAPPRRSYSSAGGAATDDDAVSTEGMEFDLDGVTFICHGIVSAFDLAEFARAAGDAGPDIADPGVIRILADFMQGILGDPTYDDVTRHRRKHRTPDPVIQQILFDLIEDLANRPTQPSSASPDGQPAAAPQPDASPSPAGTEAAPDRAAMPAALAAALSEDGDIIFASAVPAATAATRSAGRPATVRTINLGHPERFTEAPLPEAAPN